MTIAGDLEAMVISALMSEYRGGDLIARRVVDNFFDFLTDGNVIDYLHKQIPDEALYGYLDAVTVLKAKCIPKVKP